jgi:hypothetical protein
VNGSKGPDITCRALSYFSETLDEGPAPILAPARFWMALISSSSQPYGRLNHIAWHFESDSVAKSASGSVGGR